MKKTALLELAAVLNFVSHSCVAKSAMGRFQNYTIGRVTSKSAEVKSETQNKNKFLRGAVSPTVFFSEVFMSFVHTITLSFLPQVLLRVVQGRVIRHGDNLHDRSTAVKQWIERRFPKTLMLLVLGVLIIVIVSDVNKIEKPRDILGYNYSIKPNLVELQIGNYDYKFPQNYLIGSEDSGCNHEAVGFIAMLPKFEGKTNENIPIMFRETGHDNPTLDILFSTRRDRKDDTSRALESRLKSIRSIYGPHTKLSQKEFNLKVLKSERPISDRDRNIFYTSRNIFYSESHGNLERVIECDPVGNVKNPGCEHSFIVNDATVKITYRLRFLPQWEEIERMTRKFFAEATIARVSTFKRFCKEF